VSTTEKTDINDGELSNTEQADADEAEIGVNRNKGMKKIAYRFKRQFCFAIVKVLYCFHYVKHHTVLKCSSFFFCVCIGIIQFHLFPLYKY
jgi:hypothetical protein